MRKLLTLTLAVALVLSLASVAFAAIVAKDYTVSSVYYAASDDRVTLKDGAVTDGNPMIGYGKTAYYTINYFPVGGADGYLVDYDAAKDLKVKPQWTQNADLVESTKVVKMRTNDATAGKGYVYCIAVKVKAKDTTATAEIAGKMELSVKTGYQVGPDTAATHTSNKATINPFISVGYTVAKSTDTNASSTAYELGTSDKLFEFKGTGNGSTQFAEAEEFELTLNGAAGVFTVDTQGQGKILLSSTVKYNEGLEAIYPDANYVYINGNGKSFNKTGELKLWANEGDFLYQVKGDKLVKLNAEYDDVEEAFIIKTRTLGTYVIAEEELDLSAQVVAPEAPVEEAPVPANPSTGAAA